MSTLDSSDDSCCQWAWVTEEGLVQDDDGDVELQSVQNENVVSSVEVPNENVVSSVEVSNENNDVDSNRNLIHDEIDDEVNSDSGSDIEKIEEPILCSISSLEDENDAGADSLSNSAQIDLIAPSLDNATCSEFPQLSQENELIEEAVRSQEEESFDVVNSLVGISEDSQSELVLDDVSSEISSIERQDDDDLLDHRDDHLLLDNQSDGSSMDHSSRQELLPDLIVEEVRIYRHTPNKRVNLTLSILMGFSLAVVLGLGIGHFIAWSSQWGYQLPVQQSQLAKLKGLQGDLITCLQQNFKQNDADATSSLICYLKAKYWKLKFEELRFENQDMHQLVTGGSSSGEMCNDDLQSLETEQEKLKLSLFYKQLEHIEALKQFDLIQQDERMHREKLKDLEEENNILKVQLQSEEGEEQRLMNFLMKENAKLQFALENMKLSELEDEQSDNPEDDSIIQVKVGSLRQQINQLHQENEDLRQVIARLRYGRPYEPSLSVEHQNKLNQLETENGDLKIEIGKIRYSNPLQLDSNDDDELDDKNETNDVESVNSNNSRAGLVDIRDLQDKIEDLRLAINAEKNQTLKWKALYEKTRQDSNGNSSRTSWKLVDFIHGAMAEMVHVFEKSGSTIVNKVEGIVTQANSTLHDAWLKDVWHSVNNSSSVLLSLMQEKWTELQQMIPVAADDFEGHKLASKMNAVLTETVTRVADTVRSLNGTVTLTQLSAESVLSGVVSKFRDVVDNLNEQWNELVMEATPWNNEDADDDDDVEEDELMKPELKEVEGGFGRIIKIPKNGPKNEKPKERRSTNDDDGGDDDDGRQAKGEFKSKTRKSKWQDLERDEKRKIYKEQSKKAKYQRSTGFGFIKEDVIEIDADGDELKDGEEEEETKDEDNNPDWFFKRAQFREDRKKKQQQADWLFDRARDREQQRSVPKSIDDISDDDDDDDDDCDEGYKNIYKKKKGDQGEDISSDGRWYFKKKDGNLHKKWARATTRRREKFGKIPLKRHPEGEDDEEETEVDTEEETEVDIEQDTEEETEEEELSWLLKKKKVQPLSKKKLRQPPEPSMSSRRRGNVKRSQQIPSSGSDGQNFKRSQQQHWQMKSKMSKFKKNTQSEEESVPRVHQRIVKKKKKRDEADISSSSSSSSAESKVYGKRLYFHKSDENEDDAAASATFTNEMEDLYWGDNGRIHISGKNVNMKCCDIHSPENEKEQQIPIMRSSVFENQHDRFSNNIDGTVQRPVVHCGC